MDLTISHDSSLNASGIIGDSTVELHLMSHVSKGMITRTAYITATHGTSKEGIYLDPAVVYDQMREPARSLNGERYLLAASGATFTIRSLDCAIREITFDEKGGIQTITIGVEARPE